MTTYTAITNAQIDAESFFDTVLAAQFRDNVLAIQEGDASAPSIINIDQAGLKTSTGEVSTSSPGSSILPGGTYGFYPQVKSASGLTSWQIEYQFIRASYVTTIAVTAVAAGTAYTQQRYISACPPHHSYRANDAIPLFVFGKLNKSTGNIDAAYTAVDPPWDNNGPTILNPFGRLQQLAGARMPGKWDAIKDDATQRISHDAAVDDLFTYMRDPNNTSIVKTEMARKFTQAEKNADMALIPHPFPDYDPATHQIVIINPTDDRMCGNLFCRHTYLGDSIAEMLHGGYFTFGNTAMPGLKTPSGVMAVTATLKLT